MVTNASAICSKWTRTRRRGDSSRRCTKGDDGGALCDIAISSHVDFQCNAIAVIVQVSGKRLDQGHRPVLPAQREGRSLRLPLWRDRERSGQTVEVFGVEQFLAHLLRRQLRWCSLDRL